MEAADLAPPREEARGLVPHQPGQHRPRQTRGLAAAAAIVIVVVVTGLQQHTM